MKAVAIVERDTDKRQKKILAFLKKQNQQVLILVPEKHMLDAYKDAGTIFHAGLTISEKKSIWAGVSSGKIEILIGTQKALFLPYKNLRTIVIDEEQYESYKLWDQYPRLHTVRGAQQLAHSTGADIIYASSYPSIALRYAIQTGLCKLLYNHPVQLVPNIIPFSFEDRKWKRAVPDEVSRIIRAWARKGMNVLVVYNKKDSAPVHDAITRRLGKSAIKNIHLGTSALLSDAAVLGIDRVGWLFPEFGMRAYDYRAEERVRIMAARLQSLTPKTSILIATRYADVARRVFESAEETWYAATLEERSRLYLPPFSDLVRLTVRDKNKQKAEQRAIKVRELLNTAFADPLICKALGPFQEYRAKPKKMHEFHLLLAGPLDTLIDAYQDVPIDSADIDPHRIV